MKSYLKVITVLGICIAQATAAFAQVKPLKDTVKIKFDTIGGLILQREITKVEGARPTITKEKLNLLPEAGMAKSNADTTTVVGKGKPNTIAPKQPQPAPQQKAAKKAASTQKTMNHEEFPEEPVDPIDPVDPGEPVNPTGPTLPSAGPTLGQLDVSATGGATYTVPISLPPGLGNMVPQISLSYNSQGGNGVVGIGWNIGGLSAITRIPTTQFHDNKIAPVSFNANDRFALDGQRLLLKSGTYGADGAEYQTESYSNIKIVSKGVSPYGAAYGPAYFEVYHPDGSKTVYGETANSRTTTTFAISYSQNPLGARINYTYSIADNTAIITQIAYGNLGGSQTLNKINFYYSEINRAEMGYAAGDRLYRKSLLNKIAVTANGTSYRNFLLTYQNVNTLNYKRVVQITEYNGDQTSSRTPLYFSYGSTGDIVTINNVNNLSVTGIGTNNSFAVTADFTGNGTMDFLLVPNAKDKFYAFYEIETNSPNSQPGYEVNTGTFEEIFPVSLLSWNNTVLPGQGMVMVKKQGTTAYKFNMYASAAYAPVLFQYDRVWTDIPAPYGYYSECDNQFHANEPLEQMFFSGDFNGDGLTDIMAINRPGGDYVVSETMEYGNCSKQYGNYNYSQVHFINLDRRLTSNFITTVGGLFSTYQSTDKIFTADFNGDGKTDILHMTGNNMFVYGLNDYNSGLQLLWQTTNNRINTGQKILMGDYNADGKADVMFSTGYNSTFAMFLSTGKGFQNQEENYPFSNTQSTYSGGELKEYRLIPTDVNGDGKTDIISTNTQTWNAGWYGPFFNRKYRQAGGNASVTVFHNTGTSPSYKQHFVSGGTANTTVGAHYPMPIFLNLDKVNPKLEFGLMSNNAIRLFQFHKDFRSEAQITNITQNSSVQYSIQYKALTAGTNNAPDDIPYESGYSQTYPFMDLQEIPQLSVVAKTTRTYNGQSASMVYGYGSGVTHLGGLGFMGFGKVIRSNMHVNAYDPNRLFSITISDPQLRGAPTKSFNLKNTYISPSILSAPATSDGATVNDYISRTDYSYQTTLLPNKVFRNAAASTVSKDMLTGVTGQTTYEYDSFYNVTRATGNIGGVATEVVEATYDNNTAGYYIGRPLTRKTSKTAAGDTYTTEEQYTYTGHLPTQVKKKGHGTPWITESLSYDAFGNITQKTIGTNSGQRTVSITYDATGRFPIGHTDVQGLTTANSYHTATGNVLGSTNAYGQATTFVYDTWDRPIETTNYLGNKSYTTYSQYSNGYLMGQTDDEGREKNTYTNHLGQVTAVAEKNLTGSFVGVATEYDVYGRAYRQSQPAAPGSYSQWNETEFDEYGRVKKTTAYTGKVTNYSYNGLSATVNDGTKSVTSTKNALGQIASVQDPGGTINYSYYAHGGLKYADFDSSNLSLEYDGWGRKTDLYDPNAGAYTYAYNGFGEITQETTPKGATTYTYDAATGRLTAKTLTGDATGLSYAYSYNNTTKLLESMAFTNADGNNASYSYTYDSQKRLASTVENNLHAVFTKNFSYDAFGRIATEGYQAKDKASNVTANRTVAYTYQNGGLLQAVDQNTGQVLAKTNTLTANGQLATELQGNSLKTSYVYDAFNLPQGMVTERIGSSPATLMNLGYSFNAQTGVLNSRSNSALGWNETFTYDNLSRLTNYNDNNGNNSQSYDGRGRITLNSQLGNYGYSGTGYQQTELTNPTAAATSWYQDRSLQLISFNAFKKPVNINEQGKEQIDFQYNASLQRAHMYYGSTDADKMLRPMRRHYSEDGGMEITKDLVSNTTSFVFYLAGDAYSAPAIFKEVHNSSGTSQNLYYLHRDHLGSIVLISDVNGNAVEKRQFDAWGNIVALTDGNGNALTAFVVLDRGYTGHEHLLTVGLINMNGRMYDPKLHRFLSPDNFVQDPYNTQNFNRYGYAMNNPLMYVDKNGEFFWIPIIIGAIIGATVNVAIQASNGNINNFWDGFKAAIVGGVNGALIGASWSVGIAGAGVLTGNTFGGMAITSTLAKIGAATVAIGKAINTVSFIASAINDTENAFRIGIGRFYVDENASLLKGIWHGVSRNTWEGLQNWVGYNYSQLRNASGGIDRVDYFGGATFATGENSGTEQGVSLGHYINTSIEGEIEGKFANYVISNPLYMHEYGHTFDSRTFGLSYLFAIGKPSMRSSNNNRQVPGEPRRVGTHDFQWYEMSANRHAARYFRKHYGVDWNRPWGDPGNTIETYYPRRRR